MMKLNTFLALLLTFLIVIFSCSPGGDSIKIALIGPFSGPYQAFGSDIKNSTNLIVEEFNNKGGILNKQIELVPMDSKSSDEVLQGLFKELKEKDIRFVIGPILSNMLTTVLEEAKGNNILFMSPTISSEKACGMKDNFLRVSSPFTIQGEIFAQKMLDDSISKAAVIYDDRNKDYTLPVYQTFQSYLEQFGADIVYTYVIKDSSPVDSVKIAEEITESGAGGILFISSAADVANIFHHVRRQNKKIRFYGSHWTFATNIMQHGGKSIENMLVVSYGRRESPSDEFTFFTEKYENRFNAEPKTYLYTIHDALLALKTGIENSRSLDIEKVKAAILEHKYFKGIIDNFAIDEYGDGIRRFSLFRIHDNTLIHVGYYDRNIFTSNK